MTNHPSANARLAGILSLTVLGGCSGGAQIAPPAGSSNPYVATQTVNGQVLQRSYSVLPPAVQEQLARRPAPAVKTDVHVQPDVCVGPATTPKVYISEFASSDIHIYRQLPGFPTGGTTIAGAALINPQGMDVRNNRLYVANTGASNILRYNQCGTAPSTPMTDPAGYPVGVAVNNGNNVYVTNIFDFSNAGEVRYYANGVGTGLKIGDPLLSEDYFVTVDTQNDVFVDGINLNGQPEVDWCHNTTANVCKSGTATWQNTGIAVNFPGGLRTTASGRLIVNDQQGNITTHLVPSFAPVGASTPCPALALLYPTADCTDVALNQAGNRLFLGEQFNGLGLRVNYPALTIPVQFSAGLSAAGQVIGVATWPAPPWGG